MAVRGLLGLRPEEANHDLPALLAALSHVGLSIPVNVLPLNWPGLPYRAYLRLSERVETALKSIIARKQAALRAGNAEGGDALTILLETYAAQDDADPADGLRLTETQLLGHVTTLFTSGHETTASALTWTLFLLAQHPQVAADLADELDSVLHGASPMLAQLPALPLLDHVINESLRLFPPGMWMLRTSTAPFAFGPYHLPANTRIVYSPAVIQRRPELYTEPDRFLPGRWETLRPSPYEYLPFGAGSRRCLGATFALMELRLAVAYIAQHFRLQVPDGTRVDCSGTVLSFPRAPGGGLPVHLYPRRGQGRAGRLRGNIHALLALDPAS